MQQAEHAAAQDVLNEGLQRLPNAEMFQCQARPEREIVSVATEWRADLVMVLSVSSSQFFAAFWCLFSRVRVRRRNCRNARAPAGAFPAKPQARVEAPATNAALS